METDFVTQFFQNRKKFVMELIFWLGLLFIYGFARVNLYGDVGSYTAPVYTVYGVWGNEIEQHIDTEASVRNNSGKTRQRD